MKQLVKPKWKNDYDEWANYISFKEWSALYKLKHPGFKVPHWYAGLAIDGDCYWFVQSSGEIALGIKLSDEPSDYISA